MLIQHLYFIIILVYFGASFSSARDGVCIGFNKNGTKRYYCCFNYEPDPERQTLLNKIQCKPICKKKCNNGTCVKPDQCECHWGFIKDALGNCVPHCNDGCPNGSCVVPANCSCNHGYKKFGGICLPLCSEPCNNGSCVELDNCFCDIGYRKTEKNICEPICTKGCINGRCTSPEFCECDDGWHKTRPNTCEPTCSPSCINGYCTTVPNNCKCNDGYTHLTSDPTDFYTCLPQTTTSTTTSSSSAPKSTPIIIKMISSATYVDEIETTEHTKTEHTTDTVAQVSYYGTSTRHESTIEEMTTEIADSKKNHNILIYVSVGVLAAVILLVTIIIIIRKKCCFKREIYAVQDTFAQQVTEVTRSTEENFTVTFSAISHK